MNRRYCFAALLCAFGVLAAGTETKAQFPEREVTIIIPTSAGGGTDILFRALAKATEPHLGRPIIVVNRPGAGGAIGHAEIARAKPDGHTLGAILQQMFMAWSRPELTYKNTSFSGILMVNGDPFVITVRADSPWKTLDDLIAAAKEKPGQITLGNCGVACSSHIAAGLLEQKTGIKVQHVPFEGHAPGRTALLGGHVNVQMLTPTEAIDHIRSGHLRGLALTGTNRSAILPDVPTVKEKVGQDVVLVGWRMLGGPAGIPDPVKAKLLEAFKKGHAEPEFRKFAENGGFELMNIEGKELDAYIESEGNSWKGALSALGMLKSN
jgi:tripartite-type tricarboxylate transporter receptor subunit TctC